MLDRFQVKQRIHKAINEVRASEVKQLQRDGYEPVLSGCRCGTALSLLVGASFRENICYRRFFTLLFPIQFKNWVSSGDTPTAFSVATGC